MSGDLRELYQEIILDHAKHPRHAGALSNATATAEGYNPLCGDQIKVYARVKNGKIEDLTFEGKGCAISQASASLMAEMAQGRSVADVERLMEEFLHLVKGEQANGMDADDRDRLEALSGVREFPMRVKCATLGWHTMKSALEGGGTTTTE